MLRSLFPNVHHKFLSMPLSGPITDGFDDWLAASPTSTVFRAGSFVFYDLGFFSSLRVLTCQDLMGCITLAGMRSVA
jgi:hypothetical protein